MAWSTCSNCLSRIPEPANFCPRCGRAVPQAGGGGGGCFLVFFVFLCVVVSSQFFHCQKKPLGHSNSDLADQYFRSGSYSEAIRLDPTHAFAYYARGTAHYRKGNFDAAIADFVKAIDLHPVLARRPFHTEVYLSRGDAHQKNGNIEAAIADYAMAKKLLEKVAGDQMKVQSLQSRVLYATEQFGDLEVENESSSSSLFVYLMWFGIPVTLIGVVVLLFILSHRKEQESGDSPNADLYYNQGYTYQMNGDYDRAIADYTEAIRLDPNHAQAYNNRGIAFQTKGDKSRAVADFARAEELGLDP